VGEPNDHYKKRWTRLILEAASNKSTQKG